MRSKEDADLPVDIWRYILLFVPPSIIHNCCVINKVFNDLCSHANIYGNLVCRVKCFASMPIKIDDVTSTISISVYDQFNSYAKHYGGDNFKTKKNEQCEMQEIFKIWLKRLSKSKYLDLGSFPLDESHISNQELNIALQNIVCNDTFEALHFDGFYANEVKVWFLSHIIPKLSSEIRHISLRWDKWTLPLLQSIDIYSKIFDHFWVSVDSRSHSFQLPIYRDEIKFDRLQILNLYRLHFPGNSLQTLLSAACNLKVLHMFASSWSHDDGTTNYYESESLQNITMPPQIRSISILLCHGIILLHKCCRNIRHIELDSTTNQIGQCILQQLTNGMEYPNLRKMSICFWRGISDKPDNVDSTEKELQHIVDLIREIHATGVTKLFDNLSISVYEETLQGKLRQKLMEELSILYAQQFQFHVSDLQKLETNCRFIFDDDKDKAFIEKIFRRRFGLLRNS